MKTKKYVKKSILKFNKKLRRTLRFVLVKSVPARRLRKYLSMEKKTLLRLIIKLIRYQIKIRPRIRFSAATILILVFAFTAASFASSYVHAKRQDIKINGKPILVASAITNQKDNTLTEVSGVVVSKISPFYYIYPVEKGEISQGFSSYHPAYDIATELGSVIHPIGPGRVTFAGFMADGHGNTVVIDHGDGLDTLYAHMGNIKVGIDNTVDEKTELGTVGMTGHTTGPHVHMEVMDLGTFINPGSVLPENKN